MYLARASHGLGQYREQDGEVYTAAEGSPWFGPILDTVGDVGREAAGEIRQRLIERYAPEAWDRMTEEERAAAMRAATADYRSRLAWVPWALGAALVLVLVRS